MSLSLNQLRRDFAVPIGISSFLAFFSFPAFAQVDGGVLQAPPGTTQAQVEEFNRAAMLLSDGKAAEAVKVFEKVCNTIPGFAEAHQMYGSALFKIGKVKEAEVQLKKANAIKPNMPEVIVNLGSVYQMEGRYAEAISQFKHYLEKFPNGPHAAVLKGMMNALQTEKNRNKGIESSVGKDNYLEEALALGLARWRPAQMPINVVIADGSAVKGFKSAYADILKMAFVSWAEASEGKIKVEFGNKADDASILCTWVDDPKEVLNPSEGGQAILARDDKGRIIQVKMKLLTESPNSQDKVTEATMRHVCLHEVGHALGMEGHSSQPDDIMFLTLNANSPRSALSERDKRTLVELYSASDEFMSQHLRKNEANNVLLGNETNPQNRAIILNSEGVSDFKAGRYEQGLNKFQDALKLTPENFSIYLNVGNAYLQMGQDAYNSKKFPEAELNLNKAADSYIKGKRVDLAKTAYGNLAMIARVQGHEAEAKKVEARAAALK